MGVGGTLADGGDGVGVGVEEGKGVVQILGLGEGAGRLQQAEEGRQLALGLLDRLAQVRNRIDDRGGGGGQLGWSQERDFAAVGNGQFGVLRVVG